MNIEPFYDWFADAIVEALDKHDMTYEILAGHLGVTRQQVHNVVSGKSRVLFHQAVLICGILDIDMNQWKNSFRPAQWVKP